MVGLNPLLSEAGFSTSKSYYSFTIFTRGGLNPLLSEAGFSTSEIRHVTARELWRLNPLLSEAGFSTPIFTASATRAS